MRLVLDTNVVASALLWQGAPRRLLELGRNGTVQLFTSTPLLFELTEILARPKFATKITASQYSAEQLAQLYAAMAAVVRPTPVPRIAPDPDDDVVIGTALAAKADFVVTGDLALLSVGRYESVLILSVRDVLETIL